MLPRSKLIPAAPDFSPSIPSATFTVTAIATRESTKSSAMTRRGTWVRSHLPTSA